jgi:outer membrane protein TolC
MENASWPVHKRALFVFFLLSLLNLRAAAQQSTGKPSSLANLIEASVRHYPAIRARQAQIDAGKATVEDARKAWLPAVRVGEQVNIGTDNSLSGAYFTLGFVPSASGGRRAVNRTDLAAGNVAALTAEWEVYNFGGYDARTKEAEASLGIDEAGMTREQYQVEWAVVQQYFELLKYRSMLTVQRNNIDRTLTVKNAVKAFADNGLRPGVDTSVADAELSKARLVYLDMANAYALVRSQISGLTGIDTAAIVVDTAIYRRLAALFPLIAVLDTNAMQHPAVQYSQAIYQDNIARETLIRKSYMPKLYLMGSGWLRGSSISPSDVYNSSLGNGLAYSRSNYLLGGAITYNLLDPLRVKYKSNIQRAVTEVARQNVEEQKLQVRQAQQQADINVRASIERLREIPRQLTAANEAYSQKLALYNAGLTNIVDLTTTLYLLNRAETDSILASDTAWKAIIRKAAAANQLNLLLSNLN